MNYAKYFKTASLSLVVLLALGSMTACQEPLVTDVTNEAPYQTFDDVYGYLRDVQTERTQSTITIHDGETIRPELFLGLTKIAKEGVDVTLSLAPDYLQEYNTLHNTSFEIYPSLDLVSLEESGAILIAPGDRRSEPMGLTIAKDGKVVEGKTYAIPVVAKMVTPGMKLSSDATYHLLFVRNVGAVPDTSKGSVKTIVYFEVNDTNPLNALEFKMLNSGKMFWDVVVLFSANIKYDLKTGRAYLFNNPQVKYLLDNREQFIQPLRDAGMKVLLGVVGDHDRAGVAQLSDDMARDFAQELKATCETYGLDGISFDDEYSDAATGPGFVTSSPAAAARMCYEAKRAMPDKLIAVYTYGNMNSFHNEFDGKLPGEYVDLAVPNYIGQLYSKIGTQTFRGITLKQCGDYSIELRRSPGAVESDVRKLRADGYGYQMSFSLYPQNYMLQVPALQTVAKGLYDDELIYPTHVYDMYSAKRRKL